MCHIALAMYCTWKKLYGGGGVAKNKMYSDETYKYNDPMISFYIQKKSK